MMSLPILVGALTALTLSAQAARARPVPPPPSPAAQAVSAMDRSNTALLAGDLALAQGEAEAALALDPVGHTIAARVVLFEVAVTRGTLQQAAALLDQIEGQPDLSDTDTRRAERARLRLAAESAEGWADMAEARRALEQLDAMEALDPVERAWANRLAWRLTVREPEAARDVTRAREALERVHMLASTPEDALWWATARGRVEVMAAEQACRYDDARATLAQLSQQPLREADAIWVRYAGLRVDLRALDAAGRRADARVRLDGLASTPRLPEVERAWIEGYRGRLALEEALESRDRAEVRRLRPAYEAWAAWEPPCARLDLDDAGAEEISGGPWLRLSLTGGGTGWTVSATSGEPSSSMAFIPEAVGRAMGAQIAGGTTLSGPWGLRAEARWAPSLGASGGGDALSAAGAGGSLNLTWSDGAWTAGLGAAVSRLRVSGEDSDGAQTGWYGVAVPEVLGALSSPLGPACVEAELGLGALPARWALRGEGAVVFGDAPLRPRIGLSATMAGASAQAERYLEDAEAEAVDLELRDWNAALTVGGEWRARW